MNRERTNWLTQPNNPIEHEIIHHSTPTPIIPSPIKLSLNNCNDSFNSNTKQNTSFTPIHSAKQTLNNPIDISSPCLNTAIGERRLSSTSSNSLFFDTPNSSFSRTTTNNTTSTPQNLIKIDRETQILLPSNIDMINQLILQMNLTSNTIDYNPIELAKKLFHQSSSYLLNKKYSTMNSLINKQFIHFGRYEIEILFPLNDNKVRNNDYLLIFFIYLSEFDYLCL
jgi:hypothetical protein